MRLLLAIVIVILQQNKLNNYSGGFNTVPVAHEALYPCRDCWVQMNSAKNLVYYGLDLHAKPDDSFTVSDPEKLCGCDVLPKKCNSITANA